MHTAEIVGTVVGWLASGGVLATGGWWLAHLRLRREQARLRVVRELLDAEWQALEGTRQVREVFLVARRAMQQEHVRRSRPQKDVS